MLENISLLNAIPLLKTIFLVLEDSLERPLVLVGLAGLGGISSIAGVRYRNHLKMKKEHIDRLVSIFDSWGGVTCKTSRALNNEFISLGKFKTIQIYGDYVFARDHLKSYPCYEVWEDTMKLIRSLNKTAKELHTELEKTIAYRLNRKAFSSDIYIVPLLDILYFVVNALIVDLDRNQGGTGYFLHVDVQEKSVVGGPRGIFTLASGGSIEDLETCRKNIGDIISSKYYQGKIRGLHSQFENTVKTNIKEFLKQLRDIASTAAHTKKLKGKCKGCPRFLWVFR